MAPRRKPVSLLGAFLTWLPFAVVLTVVVGLVSVTVQQTYRQGADDPQVQLAEDTVTTLVKQQSLPAGPPAVDVRNSLAPFINVYDIKGQLVRNGVTVDGQPPTLPPGIFEETRQHGEQDFTWQPTPGVRIAAVVRGYDRGFLLAGRSLRVVEQREDILRWQVLTAWLFGLVASAAAVGLRFWFAR